MTVPIASAPGKTDADKLTILKLLAGGRDADFVAQAVNMTRDDVVLVATGHGYPDVQKMAWAVDVLQKQVDDEARASIPHSSVRPSAPRPLGAPAGPARPGTRPAPVPDRADAGTVGLPALVAQGKKAQKAATRRLAEKVETLVEQLAGAIRDEVTARREAAERAALESKVRSDIARLEAELAAKKALLTGGRATSTSSSPYATSAVREAGVDPKEVRAWARANDIACRDSGRIPKLVVGAYLAAQAGAS